MMKIVNECIRFFLHIWQIATSKYIVYEYVIEDIQLQEKDEEINTLIYYRAIGSRAVEYDSAQALNQSDVFAKFMPVHAQIIVTLATIDTMLNLDEKSMFIKHRKYIEQYIKIFQFPKGK